MCETKPTNTNEVTNENSNTNTVVEAENINDEIIAPDAETEEEITWVEYEINGYTFEYPSNLEIEPVYGERDRLSSDEVTFTQAKLMDGEDIYGSIDCPIVETGYEIWTIVREETRGFERDGRTYGATIRLVQPNEGSGAESLAFIFMHRDDFLNWGETTEEFQDTCQILFANYEDKIDVIEQIFNSVY
ncbi:hypothetical protein KJ839_03185 [Patescibacteria group bacterium]|nr:hypothetical protein [Patescibacteria group bacterium]